MKNIINFISRCTHKTMTRYRNDVSTVVETDKSSM